jgi:hypothetical protein
MMTSSFSRAQMVRDATLSAADLAEVAKCRRAHNRLGFAYQVGFVRLFNRFPAQQPLEICDGKETVSGTFPARERLPTLFPRLVG